MSIQTVNLKQFDINFEARLIDVIDFETKEVLFTKTTIPKVSRLLNISYGSIADFFRKKRKCGYYQNSKTKKRYIFKLSKDESKTK